MLDSRWNSFIASSTVMVFDTLFRPFVPFAPSPLAELLDDVTVVEDIEPEARSLLQNNVEEATL
jgi:hypothetical protein